MRHGVYFDWYLQFLYDVKKDYDRYFFKERRGDTIGLRRWERRLAWCGRRWRNHESARSYWGLLFTTSLHSLPPPPPAGEYFNLYLLLYTIWYRIIHSNALFIHPTLKMRSFPLITFTLFLNFCSSEAQFISKEFWWAKWPVCFQWTSFLCTYLLKLYTSLL